MIASRDLMLYALTVDFRVVGATVEEDTGCHCATVAYDVVEDLHVVAALGGNDT